jgi:ring-1,2-phenylacetyl-CoA epoxidase subunit PaaC
MGDGTEESHTRIQKAINFLWEYTGEMFMMDAIDQAALEAGYGVDNAALKNEWNNIISAILNESTLEMPADGWFHKGGKIGRHSEHMGFILAEMQFLQKTYPGAKW